jgi:hypothetical protein
LNIEQVPDELLNDFNHDEILKWIKANPTTDAQVCDCCGNGEYWYDIPGEHYNLCDPHGPEGPYAYNGGLCECN